MVESVAAWLITYAIHSTVVLTVAAILSAIVLRRDAIRDVVWKAALVGSLVSATAPTENLVTHRSVGT